MTRTTHRAGCIGWVGAPALFFGVGIALLGSAGDASADTGGEDGPSSPRAVAAGPAAAGRSAARLAAAAAVGAPARTQQRVGGSLFARTPRLAYNAAQNTQGPGGAITGTLNASHAVGYPLTYTAGRPARGSVEVHPNGTFTYTPDPDLAALGGTDTFTVVADDRPANPRHWHGAATFFAPARGHTATSGVTVLTNPGPPLPDSVLATTEQLAAERLAAELASSPIVGLAKVILKAGWLLAAQQNYAAVGGPDRANLTRLDQAITEYATQAALEVQLLDSANPKVIQQVAPPHNWYLQDFPGSRIWYDNPDTIYRFIGVNSASSYVLTGRFDGSLPADTNFSVLTGLSGATASNLNGRDLVLGPDGSFTITASAAPAEPGQPNHLQLPPGTTLITTRNTLSDWNSQEPMSLEVLRVGGPPPSLFSQIGGFAIPGIGPLVAGSPLLTSLVSAVPPLPGGRLVREIETAVIMLLLGISGENQYMGVAAVDPRTGQRRPPNTLSQPDRNAQFLATQLQSAGYFDLGDDDALIVRVDPGNARYFNLPVTDLWTITGNYWDEQTSLNNGQAIANPDGTYTFVISKSDPGVHNWVSTGGLNRGTISMRFQDFDPGSEAAPTVSTEVVPLSLIVPDITPAQRAAQIAGRQLGNARRWAPYPQA